MTFFLVVMGRKIGIMIANILKIRMAQILSGRFGKVGQVVLTAVVQ
jgi:hypothetical protein